MSSPSATHEFVAQLIQDRPALAPVVLREVFGMDLPADASASLESGSLTSLVPAELRADAVVAVRETGRETAVIVEVQLGRDHGKRRSWPCYLANLHARKKCRVVLLVICPDQGVADWCARPIEPGHPGWVLRPLVLGPDAVPVVATEEQATALPELGVLSALTHGTNKPEVIEACCRGLDTLDLERAETYTEYLLALLSGAARTHLEDLVATGTFPYMSEYSRRLREEGEAKGEAQGEARGEARGRAEAVVEILTARGVPVTEEARHRILTTTDPDRLRTWTRQAITAATTEELLGEE